MLAWTAALLERAAASPGAPDWKGLLGAAERAFDDRVRREFRGEKRVIQGHFNLCVAQVCVSEQLCTLRERYEG